MHAFIYIQISLFFDLLVKSQLSPFFDALIVEISHYLVFNYFDRKISIMVIS